MYDLTRFRLEDMVRCGSELRNLASDASHMEPVARVIVRHLYDNLRDGPAGPRACALVRIYKTHPFVGLDPDLRARVRANLGDREPAPAMKCLTLLATAGDEPTWNDRRESTGHQAIPLISPEQIDDLPMVAQLIRQLGVATESLLDPDPDLMLDLEQRTYNVFHVLQAEGSPHIPAQTGFVIPYGIASVLGFGGMLPSGDLVAVLLFSKVPIPAGTAEFFKTIALNIKVALLPHDDAVFAPPKDQLQPLSRRAESRLGALTQLLDVQERTALSQTLRLQAKNEELEVALQQLHETQAQLVAKERLASLGALTAGIAHEIKNPLNFVTNFAHLSADLIDEFAVELAAVHDHLDADASANLDDLLADLKTNAQKIQEHGKRADGIVSTMLLHSRGEAARIIPTDLNDLLKRYADLAYHGLRAQDQTLMVAVQTELDPSIGKVGLIAEHFSRVILNLVNNACYAAHQKRAKGGDGFTPTVLVSSHRDGDRITIRVRDNGEGIPEAIRSRIFDPFFTTKPAGSGTGLGLSLSHDIIVAEHGGSLRVESTPGAGSEFIVSLPQTINPPAPTAPD